MTYQKYSSLWFLYEKPDVLVSTANMITPKKLPGIITSYKIKYIGWTVPILQANQRQSTIRICESHGQRTSAP